MAFRTSKSLSATYENLKYTAAALKTQCAAYRTNMAAGPVAIYDISTTLLRLLVEAAAKFSDLPEGIAAYAQEQDSVADYDVVTEFQTMYSAVTSARDWLIQNLPKDSSNRLLERQINADGSVTNVTVSSTQTATLQTLLADIEATIE